MTIDLKDRDLNVFDLTIPESGISSPHPFLPERDISSQDWANITEQLDKLKKEGPHLNIYEEVLMDAYFLFPDRFDLETLYRDEKVQNLVRYKMERAKMNHEYIEYLNNAAPLRLLFPKSEDNYYKVGLKDWGWALESDLEERISVLENAKTMTSLLLRYTDDLVSFKAIYPRDFNSKVSRTNLESALQKSSHVYFGVTEFAHLRHMANLRLLFSGNWQAERINWNSALSYLNSYSQTDSVVYAAVAFSLKILAADEVVLDEKGLKITMEKDSREKQSLTIPVERSF